MVWVALDGRYQAGSSVYQLAKHYGIHRITVGKHLHSRGIDTTAPALTDEQVRGAVRHYAEGWSCKKLAVQFDIGAEPVRERLHQARVAMQAGAGSSEYGQPAGMAT